ncbi:VOC family protein [Actinomycetospora corticicola]|uniref:Catechol 2,3-dioxygenase-like lactoylglutathione lyase family enzyme n=1 Tax=Actinomycetospora corticicola TaxID=663602 RepID=A0A7Y9DUP8_9PSEU|nr:catechol 2,3-dioxygenase-like lactoylglutathione lyase family enzyme [Actinomycetospora corticicola]
MTTTVSGIAHVALVVRDMAASAEFYGRVLGFEAVTERLEGPPEARHPRQLLRHPGSGITLGIHEPLDGSGERFSPQRTGLDHVALTVADRTALDAWGEQLDAHGVEHSPVRDIGYAQFISFADPDGIAWEVWLPTP